MRLFLQPRRRVSRRPGPGCIAALPNLSPSTETASKGNKTRINTAAPAPGPRGCFSSRPCFHLPSVTSVGRGATSPSLSLAPRNKPMLGLKPAEKGSRDVPARTLFSSYGGGCNLPRNASLGACPVGERTAPEHHSEEGRWKTREEPGKKKKRQYIYINTVGSSASTSCSGLDLLLLFLISDLGTGCYL